MKQKVPSELINKYLKGECSPAEEKELHQWYNSFEDRPDTTTSISAAERAQLKQRMFEEIKQKAGIEADYSSHSIKKTFNLYSTIAGIAAMLVLAISAVFYFNKSSLNKTEYAVQPQDERVINSTQKLVKHVFPDGSIAWMRPSTIISYKKGFNSSENREISMKGEAFFEIKRNPKRPFIVKTGEVYTKVLGTSFNVKSYKGDKTTEVSVVTGKVMVYTLSGREKDVKQEAFLLPKEKVIAAVTSRFEKKSETNKDMDIWQKRSLSFNNVPVKEVVAALNERFKVAIEIKDPIINQYQLTADFTDVNLPSVLELLSKSLSITYEINNTGITMSKEPLTN